MKPFYQEPNSQVYCGHVLDVLPELPAESVDCVPTSPPYWGLRSYKTEPIIWGDNHCGHEWGDSILGDTRHDDFKNWEYKAEAGLPLPKAPHIKVSQGNFCLKCGAWKGELGLEPTIELYISHLLEIFDEVKRVLKKTGTLWVNIGDSYAASGGEHKPWHKSDSGFQHNAGFSKECLSSEFIKPPANIAAKSLCLIPERFALGMVERGWILRNVIIWYKPNPMPESVKDRFTGSYEYLYFFTKSRKYCFEQQFEPYLEPLNRWGGDKLKRETPKTQEYKDMLHLSSSSALRAGHSIRPNELGRNKRDVWEIPTRPYPGAHFAVFSEELVEIPILAGCPSMICKKCGKAREKIYEEGERIETGGKRRKPTPNIGNIEINTGYKPKIEVGYTDCGCNVGFELGVVMDPFAGSGTTGAMAKRLGRKYIGIDVSEAYCKLHVKRLQEIPLAMELVN